MPVMKDYFDIPEEEVLLEVLGAEPTEAKPEDGYWRYELSDDEGVTLQLSWNTHERSLQTTLLLKGRHLCTTSQEGASRLIPIEVNNQWVLRGEFYYNGAQTIVDIQAQPLIQVRWSTLVLA